MQGKFNPISRLMSAMIPLEMPSLSGNTRRPHDSKGFEAGSKVNCDTVENVL